jgi:Uma2 family endonuclease
LRNPDTVLAPDVPFVRQERDLDERGFYPGPPDLAVEVISPSDTYTEVDEKVAKYLACGTPMVIVVDPRKRSASVYTPGNFIRVSVDDTLDGGDVVPGWKLPLRELFE